MSLGLAWNLAGAAFAGFVIPLALPEGALRSTILEYVSSAHLNDLVHQVNQVRALVCLLVLLCEMLDSIVDEIL